MVGFIALLKVAVMTAVLGQIKVDPSRGVTDVTIGVARGSPGATAFGFLSGSLHPVIIDASSNTETQSLPTFNLHISFSSSAWR